MPVLVYPSLSQQKTKVCLLERGIRKDCTLGLPGVAEGKKAEVILKTEERRGVEGIK